MSEFDKVVSDCGRQRRFDFNRAAKLRLLDKMMLPREKLLTNRGTLKRGAEARIASLVRVIESCIGDAKDQICWACEATIGERMKCSERQVRRVIREAEALGVIRSKRRGRQKTNLVSINWSVIWEWAGESSQPDHVTGQQAGKVTGQQAGKVTGQQGRVTGQQGRVTGPHSPPIRSIDPLDKSATSPSPEKTAAGDTCAREQNSRSSYNAASEFELVVVAMRGWEPEPINGADSAVAEAKARGVTASELLRILRVAREAVCVLANGTETKSIPAWGAGAIRNRVAKARPGENAAQLWPPKSDQYLKAVLTLKREQEAQAAARRNSEQQAIAATVQADDADRLTALESNHGHELDQLSTAALGEVIAASGDCVLIDMSRRIDPRKRGSSLRRRLLLLLEREGVSV